MGRFKRGLAVNEFVRVPFRSNELARRRARWYLEISFERSGDRSAPPLIGRRPLLKDWVKAMITETGIRDIELQ